MAKELKYDKAYKTFVGQVYYHYSVLDTQAILPYPLEQSISNIVSDIENGVVSNGGEVLRIRIHHEILYWGIIPYNRFYIEYWFDVPSAPASEVRGLALPVIVIFIIKAVFATILLWLVYNIVSQFTRPTPISQFVCPVCGAVFSTAGAYDAHMCIEHGVCKFTCPYCGASFDTADLLARHIAEAHPASLIPGWVWIAIAGVLAISGLYVVSRFIPRRK